MKLCLMSILQSESEESSNELLAKIQILKKNFSSGSQRYRKMNTCICKEAIESTKKMI
jgi:hypothetical protein